MNANEQPEDGLVYNCIWARRFTVNLKKNLS